MKILRMYHGIFNVPMRLAMSRAEKKCGLFHLDLLAKFIRRGLPFPEPPALHYSTFAPVVEGYI